MTGCKACEEAETNPRTGLYTHNCMQCEARALAQSDEAKARLRAPSELDVAMRKTWVSDADYRRGRSMVWAWIKRLEA
jgi:hypothetical protein